MVFKVLTVLCATLAFARAGLLAAAPAIAYSPANEVSHVYSSIGAVAHQPLIAQGLNSFYSGFFFLSLYISIKFSTTTKIYIEINSKRNVVAQFLC